MRNLILAAALTANVVNVPPVIPEPDLIKARQVELTGNELIALQGALVGIERRERIIKDGSNEKLITESVPVCLKDNERRCIPHDVSLVVARNLRALQVAVTDFQKEARTIQGEETHDTGYADPETADGKATNARANFRLAKLAAKAWPVLYWPVDFKALDDRQVDVPSSTRAIVAAVQPEVLEEK
jgi:hypothetical protein